MKSIIKNESGMTLVESLMAILILLAGLLSMAQVLAFSVVASKTHGRDASRATAVARDKMEELLALEFSDTTTNVSVFPHAAAANTGLSPGYGSVYPDEPVDLYHDCLDAAGARTTNAGSVAYTRQWKIVNVPGATKLKQILVSVRSNKSFRVGTAPSTLLISQKTEQKAEPAP
jgi:type II secretory pathway pseudopilin PulG